MKFVLQLTMILLLCAGKSYTQHIYQIRADSVRIYNVCDTAELIIENRTRGVSGYLYNKGNGRTEFRKIDLVQVGGSRLAIAGQDTIDLAQFAGVGGIDTAYRFNDSIRYLKNGVMKGIYAPVLTNAELNLQAVTTRGAATTNNIQFNNVNGNPSNGLVWTYNTDNWKIYLETKQDTPSGNLVFEAADNSDEGWVFRHVSRDNGVFDSMQVLTLGRGRFLYRDADVWHAANHPAGAMSNLNFTGAHVPGSIHANQAGHITSVTSRMLTPADIGAARDTISLAGVLANGAKAISSIQLGDTGVLSSLNLWLKRKMHNVNYTGSMGLGINQTSIDLTITNGVDSLWKRFYLPFNGTGPLYSGDNGTTVHKIWHSGIDGAGSTLDADLLDGMGSSTGNTPNSIAARDAGGSLSANQFTNAQGNVVLMSNSGKSFTISNQEAGFDGGTVLLKNEIANRIQFATPGVAPPSLNTRSPGTKLVLYPSITAGNTDFAIGVESNNIWFSTANASNGFKWYSATNSIAALSGAGNFITSGNVTATAFYQSSLRKLKKDIHPFKGNALSVLQSARVRSFRFKADTTGHISIGFIADEVPAEFATPGRTGVDQANLAGLLVKALQELKTEKDAMETELKAKNEALEARLNAIEALLKAREK